MGVLNRVRQTWNAFRANEQSRSDTGDRESYNNGPASYGASAPQRPALHFYNERSIISSIYTRIAIDVSGILIRHIKVDEDDRYSDKIKSQFDTCLRFEPNMDQGPRAFRQDLVSTLFDKGVSAVVPVDTVINPEDINDFEIWSMRIGEIVAWYPRHVRVSLYNEAKGLREEILLEKNMVAIVENPLYAVMNAPNSTLQRLIRKLHILDAIDEQSGSGKLDIIIQLPYVIKSEARKKQAEQRRADIEFQLKGSQYGIAYTEATEKITQLNRPAENNLLKQVEYLTNMLYGQLGLTEEIMNGTADEEAMNNYFNRTMEPILDAITEAMQRTFIGMDKTQKGERVRYFRDPFKFVTVGQLAEIADKFTRNEIFSSNEIRGFMGVAPSKDPKAEQLINSNMPQPAIEATSSEPKPQTRPSFEDMDSVIDEVFAELTTDIDKIVKDLG